MGDLAAQTNNSYFFVNMLVSKLVEDILYVWIAVMYFGDNNTEVELVPFRPFFSCKIGLA